MGRERPDSVDGSHRLARWTIASGLWRTAQLGVFDRPHRPCGVSRLVGRTRETTPASVAPVAATGETAARAGGFRRIQPFLREFSPSRLDVGENSPACRAEVD